jgi:hypothetical protein
MAQRSSEEIRNSIDTHRGELVVSVERLKGEVERITDWRAHVERHRSEITIGAAAVVGLVLTRSLIRRRRRRRRG